MQTLAGHVLWWRSTLIKALSWDYCNNSFTRDSRTQILERCACKWSPLGKPSLVLKKCIVLKPLPKPHLKSASFPATEQDFPFFKTLREPYLKDISRFSPPISTYLFGCSSWLFPQIGVDSTEHWPSVNKHTARPRVLSLASPLGRRDSVLLVLEYVRGSHFRREGFPSTVALLLRSFSEAQRRPEPAHYWRHMRIVPTGVRRSRDFEAALRTSWVAAGLAVTVWSGQSALASLVTSLRTHTWRAARLNDRM